MPSISLASSLRSNLLSTYADAYSIQGLSPAVVSDFTKNYYRSGSTDSNFANTFDYTGASTKTMTDSDGKLKWGPHNLLNYSEQFDNAYWVKTASGTGSVPVVSPNFGLSPDETLTADRLQLDSGLAGNSQISSTAFATSIGTVYTFSVWMRSLSGSPIVTMFNNSATQNVTVTPTWQMFTFTQTATVLTDTVRLAKRDVWSSTGAADILVWGAHLFRSDLGGMVNNPDTGNSYVPTTASAVYLPRRGNHLYNGYAWVNKGLLLESQARTNLMLQSNTFSTTWTSSANMTVTPAATVSPDGNTNGWLWTRTATSPVYFQQNITKSASPIAYTASFYVKKSLGDYCALRVQGNYPSRADVIFNLVTGTISTAASVSTNFTAPSASIQNAGNGWYRVTLTATSDAATAIAPIISFNSNNVQIDGTDSASNSAGFIYGAQFEQAATPSSYIPTTTAQVTRAAELLQVKAPNLAVGANDFTNTLYWPASNTGGGLTVTRTAGVDATGPYIDVRYAGTATGGNDTTFQYAPSRRPAAIGDVYTSSVTVQRIAYPTVGGHSITVAIAQETAPGTFAGAVDSAGTTSATPVTLSATLTVTAGNQVRPAIGFNISNGVAIDVTYRFRGLQFDKAASRVTYPDQSNISMQIDGTMTGTPSTFTRWGGASTAYLLQSASSSVYSFAQYGGELQTVTGGSFTSGIDVPFNVASRHGANYINGAVNGTALTASSSTLPFPVLNASPIQLGPTFMGNIGDFRQWNTDVGNAGIVAASAPSLLPSLNLNFDSSNSSYIVNDWSE